MRYAKSDGVATQKYANGQKSNSTAAAFTVNGQKFNSVTVDATVNGQIINSNLAKKFDGTGKILIPGPKPPRSTVKVSCQRSNTKNNNIVEFQSVSKTISIEVLIN